MTKKFQRAKWPKDTAQRIADMRAAGSTWRAIGESFGTDQQNVRNHAMKLGLLVPRAHRRFTAEDDALLRRDYLSHVDVEETAKKIGCSIGVLKQRIYHRHKDLLGTVRDPLVTRAVKKFGSAVLEGHADARTSVIATREKILAAKAAARVSIIEAKQKRSNATITAMHEKIASGTERNVAIFEARSAGITLERIASEFGMTRERVRQICDATAFDIALGKSIRHSGDPAPVRDILHVASSAS